MAPAAARHPACGALLCAVAVCLARLNPAAAEEAPLPPFYFSAGFSNDMVLQRGPAKAAVYGVGAGVVSVKVEGTDAGGAAVSYSVAAHSMADSSGGGSSPTWKAFLKPAAAGGAYSVTASSSAGAGVLERVTFGDVYFCSGQSNMALSTHFTFSADTVKEAFATVPKYASKLRLFQYGGMQFDDSIASNDPKYVTSTGSVAEYALNSWYNASAATTPVLDPSSGKSSSPFREFSATCLYFGVELLDALGSAAPPIGLIQSAVGGSTIEAWMSNATRGQCTDEWLTFGGKAPKDQHIPGMLYYGYVTPFVNMSISGFLWYQGENNCGMPNIGNVLDSTGYSCEMPAMVAAWREVWSVTAGTTDPLAPFGIVTLASGGSEGNGAAMGAFRWAQTASYGQFDNPALPNTFGTQLYDMGDPWGHSGVSDGNKLQPGVSPPITKCCPTWSGKPNATNAECVKRGQKKACTDKYYCANPDPATGKYGAQCVAWNASAWPRALQAVAPLVRLNSPSGVVADFFMGSIHPRLKRPVGRRLAVGAVNLIPAYRGLVARAARPARVGAGGGAAISAGMTARQGPTLAGCALANKGPHGAKAELTLHFNQTLLGTEGLLLRPYETNMSKWASELSSSHAPRFKTDSEVLMVCSLAAPDPEDPTADLGNATTCQCQQWAYLHLPLKAGSAGARNNSGSTLGQGEGEGAHEGADSPVKSTAVLYCAEGPGWKPTAAMRKAAVKGRDPRPSGAIQYAAQWSAVPLTQAPPSLVRGSVAPPGTVSAVADLSSLGGRAPYAVRLAWPLALTAVGKSDDMCCTGQASEDGLQLCVPGNCPLYSSVSELPANPFFASITTGHKCACLAPQTCDA